MHKSVHTLDRSILPKTHTHARTRVPRSRGAYVNKTQKSGTHSTIETSLAHPNVVSRDQQKQRQEHEYERVERDERGEDRPGRKVLVVVQLQRQEHKKQKRAEREAARPARGKEAQTRRKRRRKKGAARPRWRMLVGGSTNEWQQATQSEREVRYLLGWGNAALRDWLARDGACF